MELPGGMNRETQSQEMYAPRAMVSSEMAPNFYAFANSVSLAGKKYRTFKAPA